MEYNDFNIMADYENMAKEYYSHMKNKGYVFMRIDDTKQEKFTLVNEILDIMNNILSGYKSIEVFLKKSEKEFLNRLYYLTQSQFNNLKDLYNKNVQYNIIKGQNVKKVISKEALLLEKLLKLMLLEEDDNFVIIKNMIFERLKILQED